MCSVSVLGDQTGIINGRVINGLDHRSSVNTSISYAAFSGSELLRIVDLHPLKIHMARSEHRKMKEELQVVHSPIDMDEDAQLTIYRRIVKIHFWN